MAYQTPDVFLAWFLDDFVLIHWCFYIANKVNSIKIRGGVEGNKSTPFL